MANITLDLTPEELRTLQFLFHFSVVHGVVDKKDPTIVTTRFSLQKSNYYELSTILLKIQTLENDTSK